MGTSNQDSGLTGFFAATLFRDSGRRVFGFTVRRRASRAGGRRIFSGVGGERAKEPEESKKRCIEDLRTLWAAKGSGRAPRGCLVPNGLVRESRCCWGCDQSRS